MALDCDLTTILTHVGHDGSEILFPDLPEPKCRRSFHIQEMISISWELGFLVAPFEPQPVLANSRLGLHHHPIMFPEGNRKRMMNILDGHSGVLTGLSKNGTDHAVAWDGDVIYNPIGEIEGLNSFSINTFWIVVKR